MEYSEFCEKMFETIVNHHMLNTAGVEIYVPSQNKEVKSGIDALFRNGKRKIAFFQYKVVRYNKSKGVFCFDLHKNAHKEYTQHNALCEKGKRKIPAGYVVPAFTTYSDLYQCMHSKIKCFKSAYLINAKHRINDTNSHHIEFDSATASLYSKEPKKLEIISLEDLLTTMKDVQAITADEFLEEVKIMMGADNSRRGDISIQEIGTFLYQNKIIVLGFPSKTGEKKR